MTVNGYVPAVVGVPDNAPVELSIPIPYGRKSVDTDQFKGAEMDPLVVSG